MNIDIHHTTNHQYESEVGFGNHSLYLRPADSHRRRVLSFTVETTPESNQRWVRDVYGNIVLICNFGLQKSKYLSFTAKMLVAIDEENPYDFILEPHAIAYPFAYTDLEKQSLLPFHDNKARPGALHVLD